MGGTAPATGATLPRMAATSSLLDLFRLDGLVAVVTGSGRGIGRGVALGLAEAGADVVVTARRTDEIEAVVAEVEAEGRRALGVAGDITDAEFVRSLVARTVDELGRLDVWVSNAGGSEHKGTYRVTDMPDEHWDAQLALNLPPALRRGQGLRRGDGAGLVAARHLVDRARSGPRRGSRPTARPRPAMQQLTQTLAIELAAEGHPGQRPGRRHRADRVAAHDRRHPGRRRCPSWPRASRSAAWATRPTSAAAAVYLASPAASWVTGQTLAVSGGR